MENNQEISNENRNIEQEITATTNVWTPGDDQESDSDRENASIPDPEEINPDDEPVELGEDTPETDDGMNTESGDTGTELDEDLFDEKDGTEDDLNAEEESPESEDITGADLDGMGNDLASDPDADDLNENAS